MKASQVQVPEHRVTYHDCVQTGPGSLAGRDMRRLWQPARRACDVARRPAVARSCLGAVQADTAEAVCPTDKTHCVVKRLLAAGTDQAPHSGLIATPVAAGFSAPTHSSPPNASERRSRPVKTARARMY